MNRLNRILCFVLGCIIFLIGSIAYSQEYPSKPIRIIIPFAAGSGIDNIGRAIGQKMAESMGQQVIFDNRPGVNGALGTEAAAKAAPDGYTLILGGSGNFAINMSLYNKLPYDSEKDFAPIIHFGTLDYFLVASNNLPVNSVKGFVDLAKASPGKRTMVYASASSQMAGELFKFTTGVNLTMVPYKSLSQALLDLASGEVDVGFLDTASALPHIQAGGRLKALAVTTPKRYALLPGVPTFAESGYPTVAPRCCANFRWFATAVCAEVFSCGRTGRGFAPGPSALLAVGNAVFEPDSLPRRIVLGRPSRSGRCRMAGGGAPGQGTAPLQARRRGAWSR